MERTDIQSYNGRVTRPSVDSRRPVVPGTAPLQHRILRTLRSLIFHADVRTSHNNNNHVRVCALETQSLFCYSFLERNAIQLKL